MTKPAVIIDNIVYGHHRASGQVWVGRKCFNIAFRSQAELSDSVPEALLLLALPAAMRQGVPLVMNSGVSPRLLAQVPRIQELYRDWVPVLQHIPIEVPKRNEVGPATPTVSTASDCLAVAFTGGVDSFYSALRSPGAALVFVHGLDVPLDNTALRTQVGERLRWAAAQMGRELLEIETNLRLFSDRFMDWHLAFGAALAACALLLSRHFNRFGIPAGQCHHELLPDGAHPALNPLCSTERLQVETIGLEATRAEKIGRICHHSTVKGALRVCWENRGNAYNCGVCEKCLRTMAALQAFGALDDCSTFAMPLDYGRLSRAIPIDPVLDMFTRENLLAAREQRADPKLTASLERALSPVRAARFRLLNRLLPRRFHHWYYSILLWLREKK